MPHYQLGHTWKIPYYIRYFAVKLYFDKCGINVDVGEGKTFFENKDW